MRKKKGFVEVEISLPDSVILTIALEAHKRDITFNAFVNELLADFVKKHKEKENDN